MLVRERNLLSQKKNMDRRFHMYHLFCRYRKDKECYDCIRVRNILMSYVYLPCSLGPMLYEVYARFKNEIEWQTKKHVVSCDHVFSTVSLYLERCFSCAIRKLKVSPESTYSNIDFYGKEYFLERYEDFGYRYDESKGVDIAIESVEKKVDGIGTTIGVYDVDSSWSRIDDKHKAVTHEKVKISGWEKDDLGNDIDW